MSETVWIHTKDKRTTKFTHQVNVLTGTMACDSIRVDLMGYTTTELRGLEAGAKQSPRCPKCLKALARSAA